MTEEQIINKILEKIENVISTKRVLIQQRGMLGDKPKYSKHGNYITVFDLEKEFSKKQLKKMFKE